MTTPDAGVPRGPVEGPDLRALMSLFPTGVAVIGALDGAGRPWGMTCSSLCSVSLDPPTLLVCVRSGSPTLAALERRGTFSVNLLHHSAQDVAELFASGDPDRFLRTSWQLPDSAAGGPHLDDAAHAVADCRVDGVRRVGDHTVVFGRVDRVRVDTGPQRAPLLYGLRRYAAWPSAGSVADPDRSRRGRSTRSDMPQPEESPRVPSPEEVLRTSGVPFTVLDHVPIVGQADAETKLGLATEQLLKTMVFRTADGGFVLAALPVTGRVHYGRLARAAGVSRSKLRQAEPDELGLLGMEPGGASPVCARPDVVTVFDASVTRMGVVYCGSGRADRTVRIQAAQLIELVEPTIEELSS